MRNLLVYTDKRSGQRFYPAPVQTCWTVSEITLVLNDRLLMQDLFRGMCFQQDRPRHPDCSLSYISLS